MTLPQPALGTPLPLPLRNEAVIDHLRQRRSHPAQALAAPGPDRADLEAIIALGLRTPDHGKLAPWRIVVMDRQTRLGIAGRLEPLAARQPDPAKALAVLRKLTASPVTLMVLSTPVREHKVPEWEQALSAGALCMNLSHAALAHGYGVSWITDWYSYDADALAILGVSEGESIAGFIHIGTATEPALERARPEAHAHVTWLSQAPASDDGRSTPEPR
ncbi:MAG: nitroreductase [Brevundimonas sp.]|jgi:nitroreductase|uniref:nitroreductase family protein n=1 Tax=Brevundimonas sp. TaxID=1871086 RepID=UPI003919796D